MKKFYKYFINAAICILGICLSIGLAACGSSGGSSESSSTAERNEELSRWATASSETVNYYDFYYAPTNIISVGGYDFIPSVKVTDSKGEGVPLVSDKFLIEDMGGYTVRYIVPYAGNLYEKRVNLSVVIADPNVFGGEIKDCYVGIDHLVPEIAVMENDGTRIDYSYKIFDAHNAEVAVSGGKFNVAAAGAYTLNIYATGVNGKQVECTKPFTVSEIPEGRDILLKNTEESDDWYTTENGEMPENYKVYGYRGIKSLGKNLKVSLDLGISLELLREKFTSVSIVLAYEGDGENNVDVRLSENGAKQNVFSHATNQTYQGLIFWQISTITVPTAEFDGNLYFSSTGGEGALYKLGFVSATAVCGGFVLEEYQGTRLINEEFSAPDIKYVVSGVEKTLNVTARFNGATIALKDVYSFSEAGELEITYEYGDKKTVVNITVSDSKILVGSSNLIAKTTLVSGKAAIGNVSGAMYPAHSDYCIKLPTEPDWSTNTVTIDIEVGDVSDFSSLEMQFWALGMEGDTWYLTVAGRTVSTFGWRGWENPVTLRDIPTSSVTNGKLRVTFTETWQIGDELYIRYVKGITGSQSSETERPEWKTPVKLKMATTTNDFSGNYDTGNYRSGYLADDKAMIKLIHDAGFRYVDLSMYSFTMSCDYMQDDWRSKIAELKAYAESLGMTFVQSHAQGGNALSDDQSQANAILVYTLRQIEICEELGIENIVVHAGYHDGYTKEQWFAANKAFFDILLAKAEECGVNVLCENSTSANMGLKYYINSGADMREFIEYVNHPNFHGCWDTGHANCEGKQYDDIIALGDELYAIHFNDNTGISDQHLLPYFGTLDIEDVIRALNQIGYSGYFTFESEASARMNGSWHGSYDYDILSEKTIGQLSGDRLGQEILLYQIGVKLLSSYEMFDGEIISPAPAISVNVPKSVSVGTELKEEDCLASYKAGSEVIADNIAPVTAVFNGNAVTLPFTPITEGTLTLTYEYDGCVMSFDITVTDEVIIVDQSNVIGKTTYVTGFLNNYKFGNVSNALIQAGKDYCIQLNCPSEPSSYLTFDVEVGDVSGYSSLEMKFWALQSENLTWHLKAGGNDGAELSSDTWRGWDNPVTVNISTSYVKNGKLRLTLSQDYYNTAELYIQYIIGHAVPGIIAELPKDVFIGTEIKETDYLASYRIGKIVLATGLTPSSAEFNGEAVTLPFRVNAAGTLTLTYEYDGYGRSFDITVNDGVTLVDQSNVIGKTTYVTGYLNSYKIGDVSDAHIQAGKDYCIQLNCPSEPSSYMTFDIEVGDVSEYSSIEIEFWALQTEIQTWYLKAGGNDGTTLFSAQGWRGWENPVTINISTSYVTNGILRLTLSQNYYNTAELYIQYIKGHVVPALTAELPSSIYKGTEVNAEDYTATYKIGNTFVVQGITATSVTFNGEAVTLPYTPASKGTLTLTFEYNGAVKSYEIAVVPETVTLVDTSDVVSKTTYITGYNNGCKIGNVSDAHIQAGKDYCIQLNCPSEPSSYMTFDIEVGDVSEYSSIEIEFWALQTEIQTWYLKAGGNDGTTLFSAQGWRGWENPVTINISTSYVTNGILRLTLSQNYYNTAELYIQYIKGVK